MNLLDYNWIITIFWLIFVAYWLVSAVSAKRSVKGSPHSQGAVFRIMVFIAIFLILQLPIFNTFAVYFNTFFTSSLINILGVILCALGIALAIWARRYLGRNWGMPMSIQEKSELVTSGPYMFVRHPIYTGAILALFGSMLVGGFFWLVVLVTCSVYFIYSSKVEDGLMARQFPNTYPDYKKKDQGSYPLFILKLYLIMNDKKKFATLRIIFGFIWGIDAYFKWQPSFFTNFTSYLSGNLDGQPTLVKNWITLWIHLIGVNPNLFALLVAIAETTIAIGLISGLMPRVTVWVGIAMSLVIWSTAEGFGGPYMAGSTDIGAAIMYVLVFLALYFGHAWEYLNVSVWIKRIYQKEL